MRPPATEPRTCKSVRANLWDYAARRLAQEETEALGAHLDDCRDCDRCLADISSLNTGFRHLPVQAVPPMVTTRLQVIASRERSRNLLRLNPGAWLKDRLSSALMSFNNLLRPLAVPAAGGILASCFCFSLIAHTLQLRPYVLGEDDMPVGLNTEVMMGDVSPFTFSKKDVTVELTVDADGTVTDFSPMPHSPSLTSEDLQQIASKVLYGTFTPAVRFGQRVSSKRLLAITHIDVQD
jgi:hypothetical protein